MADMENPFKRVRTLAQHVFNVFPVSGREFIRGLGYVLPERFAKNIKAWAMAGA